MKPKRITAEMLDRAHEYMRQWIDTEQWSDLAIIATMLKQDVTTKIGGAA